MSSRAFAGVSSSGARSSGRLTRARRLSSPPRRHLEVGAVLADPQRDVVAIAIELIGARVDVAEVVDDLAQARVLVAAEVELVQPLDPVGCAVGDQVEVVFHLGGEVVLDEIGEVLLEQPHDAERDPVRHQRGGRAG